MMVEPPPPALNLDIDCHALVANWKALRNLSGGVDTGAAVKANAYGVGAAIVVPALREAGARTFFVAHWQEAAELLHYTAPGTICVLHGPATAEEAEYARSTGIVPVINSVLQAQIWRQSGGGLCHAMVDSGINRLGIAIAELRDDDVQALEVDLLMSHLACADEDSAMNLQQKNALQNAASLLPHRRLSLANSAGMALGRDYAFDLTRPGLSLYGGVPRDELRDHIRQVVYPYCAVLRIRALNAGDGVGYNSQFIASRAMRIALLTTGYADGFLCSLGTHGQFRFAGQELAVLGKVSMDMVAVDVTECPAISEGDWVSMPYDLSTISDLSGLSQYELLTVLGRRYDRRAVNTK